MSSTTFNVSSVTNAMKGKAILERNGLHAYVSRALDENGNNGCGYSLLVSGDTAKAESLLRASGIRITGKVPADR